MGIVSLALVGDRQGVQGVVERGYGNSCWRNPRSCRWCQHGIVHKEFSLLFSFWILQGKLCFF